MSENNEATLRFHSDYSVSASGFSIQWRAVDVSGCPIQLLTAREGVIYSPNYPHFLLAHLDCTFTVLAPGKMIYLPFEFFFFMNEGHYVLTSVFSIKNLKSDSLERLVFNFEEHFLCLPIWVNLL